MKQKLSLICVSTLLCLTSSFALAESKKTLTLDDIKINRIKKTQREIQKTQVNDARAEAIQDIATRLGASAGLAAQMEQYEQSLEARSAALDKQYNFEMLKLAPGFLPPVLSQGMGNYEKDSEDVVVISDKNFKIESPARSVSVYPTWRDYLKFNFKAAELPDGGFLPKSSVEKKIWDEAVEEGWQQGIRQASQIYENAFAELNRDFEGMILYKKLLAQGMITPTVIASNKLGVTGNENEMSVNKTVVTITDHSGFITNQNKWKTKYPSTYRDVDNKDF